MIGFDTRQNNDKLAKEVAAILVGNGIPVKIIAAEATATPVLAYLASVDDKIGGVINLTASHNFYTDDGFKFSPRHGGAADKNICA